MSIHLPSIIVSRQNPPILCLFCWALPAAHLLFHGRTSRCKPGGSFEPENVIWLRDFQFLSIFTKYKHMINTNINFGLIERQNLWHTCPSNGFVEHKPFQRLRVNHILGISWMNSRSASFPPWQVVVVDQRSAIIRDTSASTSGATGSNRDVEPTTLRRASQNPRMPFNHFKPCPPVWNLPCWPVKSPALRVSDCLGTWRTKSLALLTGHVFLRQIWEHLEKTPINGYIKYINGKLICTWVVSMAMLYYGRGIDSIDVKFHLTGQIYLGEQHPYAKNSKIMLVKQE